VKIYLIRVLEIDYDDGEYSYHQVETDERFGPFPSLPFMMGHIHDKLPEDIAEAVERRYN
jgi:hypothetical protein